MSEDKLIKTRITGAGMGGVGGRHWEPRFVAAPDVRKLMSGLCVCVCTSLCSHRGGGKGQSPLEFRGTSYRYLFWILNYQSLSFTDPEHRTAAAPTAEPVGPPSLSASRLAGPKPADLLWSPHTGPHPFPLGHSPLGGPSLQEAQTWRRPCTA